MLPGAAPPVGRRCLWPQIKRCDLIFTEVPKTLNDRYVLTLAKVWTSVKRHDGTAMGARKALFAIRLSLIVEVRQSQFKGMAVHTLHPQAIEGLPRCEDNTVSFAAHIGIAKLLVVDVEVIAIGGLFPSAIRASVANPVLWPRRPLMRRVICAFPPNLTLTPL